MFATLLIVFMVPVARWLQLLLLVVGVPVASYVLAKDVWLCLPRSWVRLELTHQGEIKLTRKNGQMGLAQILPSSYVTSSLTILHLKLHINRWLRICLFCLIVYHQRVLGNYAFGCDGA